MSPRPAAQLPFPARLAENLLSIVVRDPEWRDSILGDLREEHARLVARVGESRASRWHLRQSLGIAFRHAVDRLLRRPTRPRATFNLIELDPGASWISGLTRDFRYAWRAVWQRPAVSFTIIVTLGLALAANSTTFSLMDAIVLRPYRFAGVDRLIAVASQPPSDSFVRRESVTRADYRDWTRDAKSVRQFAAFEWWDVNLSGVENPELLPGFRVTPEFFALLSAPPVIGRTFSAEETQPGKHRVVVLGHDLWVRRFDSNPAIIGQSLRLNGEPYAVVGIAPEGFKIPLGGQIWTPISYDEKDWNDRLDTGLTVIGRLADGQSLESARAEITAIVERQKQEFPNTNAKRQVTVTTFAIGMNDPGAGPFIGTWQVAAALLLLIACANIANLLLARSGERSQEFAVRLALGSTRVRLFWQTVLEGLILSLSASLLSLPLAWAGLGLSRRSVPDEVIRFVPGWTFIQLDVRLLVFTGLLGTLAMLIFSLAPAMQATRARVSDSLRQSGRSVTPGRRRNWTRNVLASAQVALALGVLFGSGLMMSVADESVNGALGFDKDNVLLAQMNLPERTYDTPEKRTRFIDEVMASMRSIPAAANVGFTNYTPYAGANDSRRFWLEGQDGLREDEVRVVNYRRIEGDYFGALRIPLIAGRPFTGADRDGSEPVALVSAGLASDYWPNQDPIGRRFKVTAKGEYITVVGVVGNVVNNWIQAGIDRTVYRPVKQQPPLRAEFTIRTIGDPLSLAGDLRRAVAKADPDLPIALLNSMTGRIETQASGVHFIAKSLGVVALIAFALAVMGIYSLMAYLTGQRTQEIGVRMALGAGGWQVIRLTTSQAIKIIAAGTIAGVALSAGLGQLMRSVLVGIITIHWGQLALVVFVLSSVALLAAYIPARRASRLDPTTALRES